MNEIMKHKFLKKLGLNKSNIFLSDVERAKRKKEGCRLTEGAERIRKKYGIEPVELMNFDIVVAQFVYERLKGLLKFERDSFEGVEVFYNGVKQPVIPLMKKVVAGLKKQITAVANDEIDFSNAGYSEEMVHTIQETWVIFSRIVLYLWF